MGFIVSLRAQSSIFHLLSASGDRREIGRFPLGVSSPPSGRASPSMRAVPTATYSMLTPSLPVDALCAPFGLPFKAVYLPSVGYVALRVPRPRNLSEPFPRLRIPLFRYDACRRRMRFTFLLGEVSLHRNDEHDQFKRPDHAASFPAKAPWVEAGHEN